MSGGHFNYEDVRFRTLIEELEDDLQNYDLQINLIKFINEIGLTLCQLLHDLDWHVSGDSLIEDQNKFLERYKEKFLEIILDKKILEYLKK